MTEMQRSLARFERYRIAAERQIAGASRRQQKKHSRRARLVAPAALPAASSSPVARLTGAAGNAFRHVRRLDRLGNWVLAGTAARSGYDRAIQSGAGQLEAAGVGLRDAAVPLAFAAAPIVARAAGAGASRAIAAAKVAQAGEVASRSPVLKAALGAVAGSAQEVGAVLRGVQAVARFAPVAGLVLAGTRGAIDDERRVRGLVRGLVTAYDPSGIVMGRGIVERGFDALFGRSAESLKREASSAPRAYYNVAAATGDQARSRAATYGRPSNDGMTAGHMRTDPRTGRVVIVQQYATPSRA